MRAGVPVTAHTSMQVDAVFTCIRVITNAIIRMGNPRAYQLATDDLNRPYRTWLPNQPGILTKTWGPTWQFDGMARTVVSLALFGEAFWVTLTRDYLGFPSALEVLHPAFVEIKVDEQGNSHFYYGTGTSKKELDANDVTHIPFLAFPGARRGLSSIEYAGVAFALALAAMEYGQRWFTQGASPSFIISSESKLGQEEVERIAQKFLVQHSGLQSAHLPLVIDGGVKVDKVSATPDEAQFLGTLDYARMAIGSWFGLPSHLVGVMSDKPNIWGKCLSLDTPLVTPNGWTTPADVSVGDKVMGADGKPTTVTFVSPVFLGNECYRVDFNDGTSIVADAEHLWETNCRYPNAAGNHTPGEPWEPHIALRTTRQILKTLNHQGDKHNHRVRLAAPLDLPAADLPIDPYVLGVWLGDGSSAHGEICAHPDDMVPFTALFAEAGYGTKWRRSGDKVPMSTVYGLRTKLRKAGLLGNKHIPREYMRGSLTQRLALLQGLMDTDGCIDQNGRCEFTQVREHIARDLLELARSLGWRATFRKGVSSMRGVEMGPKFIVRFQHESGSGLSAFRLQRKAERAAAHGIARRKSSRGAWRSIVDIVPVESVAVRCIRVDNADHLFLAGEAMVPTHNTVQEQGFQLQDYTFSGYTTRLNEAFSSLLPRGTYAALDESEITRASAADLAAEILALRQTTVATANDIRVTKLKWPPAPGGDELQAPLASNVAPSTSSTPDPADAVKAADKEDDAGSNSQE